VTFRSYVSATLIALWMGTSAFAQNTTLPMRDAPRPQTTDGVPHVQIGVEANADLTAELLRRVAKFPSVVLGETRVSLPGAVGFQLESDFDLARPDVIVGGREFAHLHPDGSLHATLDPDVAKAAVMAGWATPHPWAAQRAGWEGFVMIYTPLNDAEFDVVLQLVEGSYSFVTGNALP
jgi:hypothetical protein